MTPERRAEESTALRSDEEDSTAGEEAGFFSRLKKSVARGFNFRRRENSDDGENQDNTVGTSNCDAEDIETGNLQDRASLNHARTQSGSTNLGSSSSSQEIAASLDRGSPRGSSQDASASQGILNGLMKFGGAALPRNPNNLVNPTCLICLEPLSQEEFADGEAIVLDCQCRGEVAMRHRACAEKWSHVKGSRTCDICKTVIKNLPEVPPRAPESSSSTPGGFDDDNMLRNNAQILVDQAPSGADVVFDCIRVTWIAMIISILFFGMDIANALWTGAIFGLGYTLFVRAMYRHQLAMLMREQQRERENGGNESPRPAIVHVI